MNNKENDDDFANPISLNWDIYTTFEQIKPESSIVTYFLYPKDELNDSILNDCKIWFDKIGYSTHVNSEEHEYDVLEISNRDEKLAYLYHLMDCLIIQQISKESSLVLNFIDNNSFFKLDFLAQVPHIETEENIEDYIVKYRTGVFDNDSELLPRTFFHLTYNNQLLGKALLEYFEGEFGSIGSTLLMFEIEEEFREMGFGQLLSQFIEKKMKHYGFDILYLSDTRSMKFWKKMGYEIDIDEGWKKL